MFHFLVLSLLPAIFMLVCLLFLMITNENATFVYINFDHLYKFTLLFLSMVNRRSSLN